MLLSPSLRRPFGARTAPCAAALAVALTLGSGRPAAGQFGGEVQPPAPVTLEVIQAAERAHLERAERFLAAGQWDEAIETLRRLMEEHGRKLAPAAEGTGYRADFTTYLPLRAVCFARLAAAPPEARAAYRARVDALAAQWLERGLAANDESLLRRIVDEAFLASAADEALLRLGELALQRGDFAAARGWWERISPGLRAPAELAGGPPGAEEGPLWRVAAEAGPSFDWPTLTAALARPPPARGWLAYPDTDLDLAAVRARLALVSILEGSPERAAAELDLLRRLHPDAAGRLAGREGPFAATLADLLAASRDWPAPRADEDWPTFAGAPTRCRTAVEQIDPGGAPRWTAELPRLSAGDERIGLGRPRVAEDFPALLSYYPVIAGDLALAATPAGLRAWRLDTGEETLERSLTPSRPDRLRPLVGAPRFTLTAHAGTLLARLGSPLTGVRDDQRPPGSRASLAGFDLATQKLLFGPVEPPAPRWEFDGVPLSDGARAYVVLRQSEVSDARVQLDAAAFDLRDGRLAWRTRLAGAASLTQGLADEITHTLLTLAEGVLYCNTNLGVVAAVETSDGAVRWAVAYPRAAFRSGDPDAGGRHYFRDLNPCLVHRSLVIAAPADSDRLFALDAATGQLVWRTRAGLADDANHLLGVGAGHLIAGGDALYWIDAANGELAARFPPLAGHGPGFATPGPTGYGRGLLAGERVYWPTRQSLLVFEQAVARDERGRRPFGVGRIDLSARGATGGNLAAGRGMLLIAGPDVLYAFDAVGVAGDAAETRAARVER